MRKLLILSLLCLTTACGGGGGGSGDGNASVKQPENSPEAGNDAPAELPVETAAITMDSLSIPDGFRFNTLETMTLTVDLTSFSEQRSFISLYSDYNSDSLKPDYSSKIVTSELSGGKASLTFTLNRAELPIIAEVQGLTSRSKSQVILEFSSQSELWTD